MKLGVVSDSLGGQSFTQMLDSTVALGVSGVEVNAGGWPTEPHFDLAATKADAGTAQGECLRDTIRVAGGMGSKQERKFTPRRACPKGDTNSNWMDATRDVPQVRDACHAVQLQTSGNLRGFHGLD